MSLARAVVPLILLVVPLGMHFGALYMRPGWAYWLELSAAIIAGLVVLWVMVRVGLAIRQRWIRHRQQRFARREDPQVLVAQRLRERVRRALELMAERGVGVYELPWYLVVGSSPQEVRGMVEAAGVGVDRQLGALLEQEPQQPERWWFTNEAVILDTSAAWSMPGGKNLVEQLCRELRRLRGREPISGVILMVGVEELVEGGRQQWEELSGRLRLVQSATELNFPVVALVAGVERIEGFGEFFGQNTQGLLGWVAEGPGEDPGRGLQQLNQRLNNWLLKRTGELNLGAGRCFVFHEAFTELMGRAAEMLRTVLGPSRFAEPLAIRALAGVATGAGGPAVGLRGGKLVVSGQLAPGGGGGFAGDALGVMGTMRGECSWPRTVQIRQRLLRVALGVGLGLAVVIGVWRVGGSVGEFQRVREELEPVVAAAGQMLSSGASPRAALDLGGRILQLKAQVEGGRWWKALSGLGRWEGLGEELGQIHRAIFQRWFLVPYLRSLEDVLWEWRGQGPVRAYAQAIATYMRWANPRLSLAQVSIGPICELLENSQQRLEAIEQQFNAFMAAGGPASRLSSPRAARVAARALRQLAVALEPSEGKSAPGGMDAPAWWLELAVALQGLDRSYHSLVAHRPPSPRAGFGEVQAFNQALERSIDELSERLRHLQQLVAASWRARAGWVDTRELVSELEEGAWGWRGVEGAMGAVREAAKAYRERVLAPIMRHVYLLELVAGRAGYGWIHHELAQALGSKAQVLLKAAQAGRLMRRLLEALAGYYQHLSSWGEGYQVWTRHIGTSTRPGDLAQVLREDQQVLVDGRLEVMQALGEIKRLASGPGQGGSRSRGLMAAVEARAVAERRPAAGAEEALEAYQWRVLESRVQGWLRAAGRLQRYYTARYWVELARKFSISSVLPKASDWKGLKASPLFSLGDSSLITGPIEEFLSDWMRDLPQELYELSGPKGMRAPEELEEFVHLNQALTSLRTRELPGLRSVMQRFVSCVHQMPADPLAAWQAIYSSPGPGGGGNQVVSWASLEGPRSFYTAMVTRYGRVVEPLLSPLVQLSEAVVFAFMEAVGNSFNSRWNELILRYETQGFNRAFPFDLHGRTQLSQQDLGEFFEDLQRLARDFRLEINHSRPGPKPRLYTLAQAIIKRFARGGRVVFIRRALALKALVSLSGGPRKVKVRVIPGLVGHYFHWVRLRVPEGSYYDLSVYGRPAEEIPLVAGAGAAVVEGLDVQKVALASWEAARGNLALVQMAYSYGQPQGPGRKRWRVEAMLPAVDSPGKMVPVELEMVFDKPLPELPGWPGR